MIFVIIIPLIFSTKKRSILNKVYTEVPLCDSGNTISSTYQLPPFINTKCYTSFHNPCFDPNNLLISKSFDNVILDADDKHMFPGLMEEKTCGTNDSQIIITPSKSKTSRSVINRHKNSHLKQTGISHKCKKNNCHKKTPKNHIIIRSKSKKKSLFFYLLNEEETSTIKESVTDKVITRRLKKDEETHPILLDANRKKSTIENPVNTVDSHIKISHNNIPTTSSSGMRPPICKRVKISKLVALKNKKLEYDLKSAQIDQEIAKLQQILVLPTKCSKRVARPKNYKLC
ncbi:hypothetical protein SLOPH_2522 [Spraguea lophii 42_110]|uniref:Uncharacterized protein n=1 Tax=Spraguea lophii (strain 42_110) TaxID=1358809 RepID=S7XFP6_SPRLO|nr:hypothetical protein SLOPH_2522 [Spraguea lophii 42_110]